MLKLRVVQARYGDCLILENGYGKRRKYILIDGGPASAYQAGLRVELNRIAASGGQLDLVVLSHVDNDHVAGLLNLMSELQKAKEANRDPLISIRRMWHNAFRKILPQAGEEADALEEEVMFQPVKEAQLDGQPAPDDDPDAWVPDFLGDTSFDIEEGVRLQLADEELGIPRNHGFPDGLVTLDLARRPERLASLRFWVLGPSEANLNNLRDKWLKWLDYQAGRVFDVTEPVIEPDDSINNLSSIMLLAESGGRRILLTGDGLGNDIVSGLETAGLLLPGETLHVDILQVPHHGSARNSVGSLYDRVTANTYVISANGRYGNPDWETLNWLVDAACRQDRDIHIFCTNLTPSLERLLRERPPEVNHYRLTTLPKNQTSALL